MTIKVQGGRLVKVTEKGFRVTAHAKPGSAQFAKFDEEGAKPTRPSAVYQTYKEALGIAFSIMQNGGSITMDMVDVEVIEVKP